MKYRIVFYCPDRHITYDGGRLPDKKGVGGGVNARIRLSQSLAALGHDVVMICNCIRDEIHLGVHYIPLETEPKIQTDILLLTTSGDQLDLSPILKYDISAKLRVILIHGVPQIKGLMDVNPDFFYTISNFLRDVIVTEWKTIPEKRIFISYRGVMESYFAKNPLLNFLKRRNRFRLAYIGNPVKGRDAAIEILRLLRKFDSRYNLWIFGDEQLWGGTVSDFETVVGVKNFGLVPQRQLAQGLLTCGFGIFLQTIREGFGQSLSESMMAGCIPLASPVGAFQERILNGQNGFFVEGDPNDSSTWENAANLILNLQRNPKQIDLIRKNATATSMDWKQIALSWEQHWDVVLGNSPREKYTSAQPCKSCYGSLLHLADGYHCTNCGRYFKEIS